MVSDLAEDGQYRVTHVSLEKDRSHFDFSCVLMLYCGKSRCSCKSSRLCLADKMCDRLANGKRGANPHQTWTPLRLKFTEDTTVGVP